MIPLGVLIDFEKIYTNSEFTDVLKDNEDDKSIDSIKHIKYNITK